MPTRISPNAALIEAENAEQPKTVMTSPQFEVKRKASAYFAKIVEVVLWNTKILLVQCIEFV
jgi:hypothetical protein